MGYSFTVDYEFESNLLLLSKYMQFIFCCMYYCFGILCFFDNDFTCDVVKKRFNYEFIK